MTCVQVVVRHADGRSCGAALVSLRTVLSSAACARPAEAGADVWAVAPAAAGVARKVVRVAFATDGDSAMEEVVSYEELGGVAGDPWAGAAADLALLELAAPLPSARAILMATDPSDCEPSHRCHLVRALRHSSQRYSLALTLGI